MVHHARTPKNRHDTKNRSRKRQRGGVIEGAETSTYEIECSLSPSKWIYSDASGNAIRDSEGAIVPVPDNEVAKLTKVMHTFPGTSLSVPKKFEGRILNAPSTSPLWIPPILNQTVSQIVYSKDSPTRFLLSEDGVKPLLNTKGDVVQAPIFEIKVTPNITLRDSKGVVLKIELQESIFQQKGNPAIVSPIAQNQPFSRIRIQNYTEQDKSSSGRTERVRNLLLQKQKTIYQQATQILLSSKSLIDSIYNTRDIKVPQFTQEEIQNIFPLLNEVDTIYTTSQKMASQIYSYLTSTSSNREIQVLENNISDMDHILSNIIINEIRLKTIQSQIEDEISGLENRTIQSNKDLLNRDIQNIQKDSETLFSEAKQIETLLQPFKNLKIQDIENFTEKQNKILNGIEEIRTIIKELHTQNDRIPRDVGELSDFIIDLQQEFAQIRAKISLQRANIQQFQVEFETFREEYYGKRQNLLIPIRFHINKSFSKTRFYAKKIFFYADFLNVTLSGEDISKIIEYRREITKKLSELSELRIITEDRFRKFETNQIITDLSGEETAILNADSEFISVEYQAEDAVLQTERWMQQYLLDTIDSIKENIEEVLNTFKTNYATLLDNRDRVEQLILVAKSQVGPYLIRPLEHVSSLIPNMMNQVQTKKDAVLIILNQIREPLLTRTQPGDHEFQKEILRLFQERLTAIQASSSVIKALDAAFQQAQQILTRCLNYQDDLTLEYQSILKIRCSQTDKFILEIVNFTKAWEAFFIEVNQITPRIRSQSTEIQAEYLVMNATHKKIRRKTSILLRDLLSQNDFPFESWTAVQKVYFPQTDEIRGIFTRSATTSWKTAAANVYITHITKLKDTLNTLQKRDAEIHLKMENYLKLSEVNNKEWEEIRSRFNTTQNKCQQTLSQIERQVQQNLFENVSLIFQNFQAFYQQLIGLYAIQIEEESLLLIV